MKNGKKTSLNSEWRDFQSEVSPPEALRRSVLESVRGQLEPSSSRVLGKLGIVHVLTSFITLSICPQFGVRFFSDGMGLMSVFMGLGEWGCPLVCGVFFLGASLLGASLVFSRAEWRKLRSQPILTLSALALPSIGFFKFMDGEFFLEFSAAWLLGAFFGGFLFIEGLWRVKAPALRLEH